MQLRRLLILTLALGLILSAVSAVEAETLLVSSKATNQVLKYDLDTGVYLGVFAELDSEVTYTTSGGATSTVLNEPTSIDIGPDGNVYVGFRDDHNNSTTGGIAYYSPTGDYLGMYSTSVDSVMNFNFDSNGDILVRSFEHQDFHLMNGPNNASPGTSVPLGKSGAGIVDNPDPNLSGDFYFGSYVSGKVFLSDGTTNFVTYGPLGYGSTTEVEISDLEFGPDGRLYALAYVSGAGAGNTSLYVCDIPNGATTFLVLAEYDSLDADLAGNTNLNLALGMEFNSDGDLTSGDDYVLVCNSREDTIAKFDMASGDFAGYLVDNSMGTDPGGLDQPYYGICILPTAANVPEPSTMALMLAGLLGLLVWRRK